MDLRAYFHESIKRGCVQLVRRRVFFLAMVVVPLLSGWFLLDLMSAGVVTGVPVGIVDRDGSALSRALERNLHAMQGINVVKRYADYPEALNGLQQGHIGGFFLIPEGTEEKTLGGQSGKISYYINYAYFSPASTQYKTFKTISLLGNGAIAMQTVEATGLLSDESIVALLQPIVSHMHAIGNPWVNYSYYLNASFVPCLLVLMIMFTTAFSIGAELKYGTSREWLASAGNSIEFAILGKLWPQTLLFMSVGWMLQFMMYRLYGMPLLCNPWRMIVAMALLVLASQAFALTMLCVAPNFRFGSTLCALMGMLSFSFCGFSIPGEAMYPWVNALGHVMPIKYYHLIAVDQALNARPLYYSRWYYAALIAYTLLPLLLLWRLKRECKNPIYVP